MRFEKVDHLPPSHLRNNTNKLFDLLDGFATGDATYARVVLEPGDYGRVENARISLRNACKYYAFPINVVIRGGELYLVRENLV